MGQTTRGGLPFNSFIGNVALKYLVRRPRGRPIINLQGRNVGFLFGCFWIVVEMD